MGNPVVKEISYYRKTLISGCHQLQYLDERPVFPRERACVEAWVKGGLEAEREENNLWNKKEQDKIMKSVNSLIELRNEKKKAKEREIKTTPEMMEHSVASLYALDEADGDKMFGVKNTESVASTVILNDFDAYAKLHAKKSASVTNVCSMGDGSIVSLDADGNENPSKTHDTSSCHTLGSGDSSIEIPLVKGTVFTRLSDERVFGPSKQKSKNSLEADPFLIVPEDDHSSETKEESPRPPFNLYDIVPRNKEGPLPLIEVIESDPESDTGEDTNSQTKVTN